MFRQPGLFRTYWIAGYEGADHINGRGVPQSLNDANGHNAQISDDYGLLNQFQIKTVRESIGWRLTEQTNSFNWKVLESKAIAAQNKGIQVIWSLMHYGFPAGIDPYSPKFVSRFAAFCEQVARKLLPYHDEAPFYQPLNEISFLTWAISNTGLIHPFDGSLNHRSNELKRQLVLAALKGSEAIWSVDPRARIIHTDPVINIALPYDASAEHLEEAKKHTEYSFEAWDMLSGKIEPGLGGSKRHLDIIGMNYYHDNQWEQGTNNRLFWHLKDPRRLPFHVLAAQVWQRYERPMFIAETSHVGDGRAEWLDDMAVEVIKCEKNGTPIEGVCLYPIIDRPDWENPEHWHKSGLWDIDAFGDVSESNLADPNLKALIHDEDEIVLKVKPSELITSNLQNMFNPSQVFDLQLKKSQKFTRVLNQPYADRLHFWQSILPSNPLTTNLQNKNLGATAMQTILVFSHLRWNFVYQRPQHLLTRLSSLYKIIFIEEPIIDAHEPYLERSNPWKNVEVLRPHLIDGDSGFSDTNAPSIRFLLDAYLANHQINHFWLWFYTPMALSITHHLPALGQIYDCMDELSAFKNAPAQLIKKEDELFEQVDIVFTGGPSLYESKKLKHDNVYCYPSSVEADHYAPQKSEARLHNKVIPLHKNGSQDNASSTIRIGYFGVIDERIDVELIAQIASSHPEWHIIMVGPVVKINPDSLPQKSNIDWLGQKPYEALPKLIASWDLCLLPFALNESTRFISPTKTLEYMAAERPIVSTNIRDVAEPYGHVVPIGHSHHEFIQLCEDLINEPRQARQKRIKKMREIVEKTSWDKTALAMHQVIVDFNKEINPSELSDRLILATQNELTRNQSRFANGME